MKDVLFSQTSITNSPLIFFQKSFINSCSANLAHILSKKYKQKLFQKTYKILSYGYYTITQSPLF